MAYGLSADGSDVIDRECRDELARLLREYLAGELDPREFFESLAAGMDSRDSVIVYVATFLCFGYAVTLDRDRMDKASWDHVQRLLLLLASDCRIEETRGRWCWSFSQLTPLTALAKLGAFVWEIGGGHHLAPLLLIPCGVVSIGYSKRYGPRSLAEPFQSLGELRRVYESTDFRKTPFPPAFRERARRTSPTPKAESAFLYGLWVAFSPLVLLVQALPTKTGRLRVVQH